MEYARGVIMIIGTHKENKMGIIENVANKVKDTYQKVDKRLVS